MLGEKSTISARVSNTLKKIVVDSEYSHKEAYELGAGLIAVNKAEETKTELEHDPTYEKTIKEKKTKLLRDKKRKLEKELEDL